MWQRRNSRKVGDIACIFVHAGAGYHSKDNELLHLQACNDACRTAMKVLSQGGSAIDAVEMAIAVLEDREITNSGFGSNLGVNGVVECDAVVVDHLGRSGGAAAVAQVKNPIQLARLLLDRTTQPLSLRRVPPNLLAGQGATNFASDHGMPIYPFDFLISPVARQRWIKWINELQKAERLKQREEDRRYGYSPSPSEQLIQYNGELHGARGAHERAMWDAAQIAAQPISPPPSDSQDPMNNPPPHLGVNNSRWAGPASAEDRPTSFDEDEDEDEELEYSQHPDEYIDPYGPPGNLRNMMHHPFANSTQKMTPSSSTSRMPPHDATDGGHSPMDSEMADPDDDPLQLTSTDDLDPAWENVQDHIRSTSTAMASSPPPLSRNDSTSFVRAPEAASPRSSAQDTPTGSTSSFALPQMDATSDIHQTWRDRDDDITDTVGAIAVDQYGNIAAGASSGGIGMKHRGRVGPAALIGVGASVIPVDPYDEDRTSVATVTSGTGEHMATTMAANTCSERVYHSVRKAAGGRHEACDEHEAVHGFIKRDFMGHPSVQHSTSNGAIGMLSVKKSRDGVYLYFGHNTDSFALASMHSDEAKPVCTMSRSQGNGAIAQGGRGIRFRKRKA